MSNDEMRKSSETILIVIGGVFALFMFLSLYSSVKSRCIKEFAADFSENPKHFVHKMALLNAKKGNRFLVGQNKNNYMVFEIKKIRDPFSTVLHIRPIKTVGSVESFYYEYKLDILISPTVFFTVF